MQLVSVFPHRFDFFYLSEYGGDYDDNLDDDYVDNGDDDSRNFFVAIANSINNQ